MSLTKMRKLSGHKLQQNFGSGVSLTLVVMIAYLCINLIGKITAMLLSTIMLDFNITKDFSFDFIFVAVVTLVLALLLLSPLRLNIKSWYQNINGEYLPVATAFSYFANLKKYLSVLHFCVIRFIVIFLTFLVPMLPCIILVAVLRYGFTISPISLGSAFGVLLIIMVVLFAIGLVFSVYYAMGFFYTDYIYIKGISKNPFKALIISQKIARRNKRSLIHTVMSIVPYFLLCLLVVTIPFIVPKIRVRLAAYADEIL